MFRADRCLYGLELRAEGSRIGATKPYTFRAYLYPHILIVLLAMPTHSGYLLLDCGSLCCSCSFDFGFIGNEGIWKFACEDVEASKQRGSRIWTCGRR